jgi:hypothetical protein
VREADTTAFEYVTFLNQSRDTAAALWSLPSITDELLAVDFFDGSDDTLLQR